MQLKTFLPITVVGLILGSCGGGGNGGAIPSEISGTVKTSYVQGLKVCLENSTVCTYTDKNGHFNLEGKPPAKLVFYLNSQQGDIIWGDYYLQKKEEVIYPLKISDNKTIAKILGAILHAMDNDTSGGKEYISLQGKLIKSVEDEAGTPLDVENLIDFLENHKKQFVIKFKDEKNSKEKEIKIYPQNGTVELCLNSICENVNYEPVKYDWTIVILYDGDNNLEDYVDDDIDELQQVKIPPNIKIIGLVDYKGTNEGYIYETNDTTGYFQLVNNTSEPHMGDADYLYNFLSKVYEKFPSKYKALIMWNHGGAWKSLERKQTKLMAVDETDEDYLYSYEFVNLLGNLSRDSIKLNLIGFDECLMGNTEVFWDISNYTDWMVGSELTESATGWDYTVLFRKVANNPELTPEQFAKYIVDAYAEAYSYDSNITMLATSSQDIKNLVDNLNKLADKFDPQNNDTVQLFKDARNNSYNITMGLIDLYSFAVQLEDIYPEAQNIVNLIDGMYKKIIGNDYVEGLSIFFPSNKTEDDSDYYCTADDVSCFGYYNPFTATHWDDFLQKYLNATSN
jgi:hypothetical protein